PGAGYNYALGSLAHYGHRYNTVGVTALPQGRNGVKAFIPVARIADMLLHPGEPFDYDGARHVYPHIKLAYWAGGNPFHHHQDLRRLRDAFCQLDTFIVNEISWTATARHADIVFPATMTLEREDIGGTPTDPLLVAMHRVVPPAGQARNDYDIFTALADRLGQREAFTEGRDARGWLRHLYERTRTQLLEQGHDAPDFDTFWAQGEFRLPQQADDGGVLRAFRHDPKAHPLKAPSGKIQICSQRIASFGYADCRLHPDDAQARGIADGDIVRLFNDRGACLACAQVTPDVMVGVVQLPTGAWYDPVDMSQAQPLCVHGNPNVLTQDIGTSSLAQGCSGQLAAVQVERFDGPLPPIRAFEPPAVCSPP
ncbi:MAG: Asp-tRNA(Asn)/Glu-tRNA(Gln) amidotransferase GatCAB subunit C, partial [Betaproteobacteria bacterium]|nr:Asp-tRNA(Asn)/Glu-tRNA(Gln) amidotransferase GatCAB subunit C [Betaproteobacteria bacterium]